MGRTPGDIIRAELDRRGWTQADLAAVLGKHLPAVSEVIQGKRTITPDMAVSLAAALGKTPEYWATLDAQFRVSLLEPDAEIQRRARIFGYAPVRDMEKRGWIRVTHSLDALEKELCSFFNVVSLAEQPKIHANARRPLKTESLDRSQIAWCLRAAKMASVLDASKFDHAAFTEGLPEVRKLADFPEKVKHLPKVLGELGLRFIIVEPLPHSPIDGAAFWLAEDAPVVALSVRYDRIDSLWFTLAHELMHIFHKDAQSVDSDLIGESSSRDLEEIEARANRDGADFLIPAAKLNSFIIRVKPLYSKQRIIQFAHRMQIHPGIVSGQLQFHREVGWYANKEMLAKVRHLVTATALTDGWGNTVPVL